ncbi:hypothetical protein KCU76_g119, partial [Aureobasidium melanogenum]
LFTFSKNFVEDVHCIIPSNADICAAWDRASKRAHTMDQAQVGLHVAIGGTIDDFAIGSSKERCVVVARKKGEEGSCTKSNKVCLKSLTLAAGSKVTLRGGCWLFDSQFHTSTLLNSYNLSHQPQQRHVHLPRQGYHSHLCSVHNQVSLSRLLSLGGTCTTITQPHDLSQRDLERVLLGLLPPTETRKHLYNSSVSFLHILTRQMELDIAPPPCSGAEMVSSTSSRRTRLDAATTSRLLSAVTPGDSNIVGLGISFDLEPSSTISTKSFNDRSTRNSRVRSNICSILKRTYLITIQSEVQTPEACPKVSTGTSVTSQNNRDGAPTLRTSPPRWPSGVPGLGNTILGPRCPRILTASCPPAISGHNSPNLSTHVPSPTTIPLVAPQSRNSTKTVRTSTKRRASSQPSTGLSAKMARVSVDSVPVNSVPVNSPLVKHDQTDEQCMAPRRCGSRRLGLAEGEKRAMPAILWQVEKEKIEKEMERATTHEGVETLSDGNGSYVGKECSVQEGPQLLNPGTGGH